MEELYKQIKALEKRVEDLERRLWIYEKPPGGNNPGSLSGYPYHGPYTAWAAMVGDAESWTEPRNTTPV